MARPIKRGMDYFSFDVNFFFDRPIKALKRRYGTDGITAYIYLLCAVYSENGYYLKADEYFHEETADDLNTDLERLNEILDFLCERNLFDAELYENEGVLTSHGIQRRFQEAVKVRALKNAVNVEAKYWLLSENETNDYINVIGCKGFSRKNDGYSEKNDNYSEKNRSYSEKKYTKKSKEKESKIKADESKERKADTDAECSVSVCDKSPHDKTASSSAPDFEECAKAYNRYIGTVTPAVKIGVEDYLGKGVEKALVVRLIEYAEEQSKPSWQYVDAALRGNLEEGIKTLAAYNEARKKRLGTKSGGFAADKGIPKSASRFNNYEDTNRVSLTSEDILREMLGEEAINGEDVRDGGVENAELTMDN